MDILFSDITVVTMDGPVLRHAYVGVAGGNICYISQSPPSGTALRVVGGQGKVLMPGLVNAHTHIAMTALRGYADDTALQSWLFDHIFPAEAQMTPEMVYHSARLGMLEAVASGTTTIADSYFHAFEVARAADEAGIRLNGNNMITCFDERYDPQKDNGIRDIRAILDAYGANPANRIVCDVGIHAVYTSKEDTWRYAAEFAGKHGLRIQVHVSETRREQEDCHAASGMTPAAALARAGVFDVPVCAAHGVWLTDEDMDLLAAHGASVVHNPVSNAKLASGTARVREMGRRGVNVALGTDGTASNNSLDMFDEMKFAALLPKLSSYDPTEMPALQALELATVGGARALGREAYIGRIAKGMQADLIMLDFDRPHLTPCYDVVSNIVYAARGSDVVMTMVGGEILYENGIFLRVDREQVFSSFSSAVPPVLEKLRNR